MGTVRHKKLRTSRISVQYMSKIIGIIIIGVGFTIAYLMDFTLISDIIALGCLYLGGKIAASD